MDKPDQAHLPLIHKLMIKFLYLIFFELLIERIVVTLLDLVLGEKMS